MPRGLNNWTFVDIKRILRNYEFRLNHVEGSHYFYIGSYNKEIHQVCVPFHGSKSIHPKTMKSIIRQSGIPVKIWTGLNKEKK